MEGLRWRERGGGESDKEIERERERERERGGESDKEIERERERGREKDLLPSGVRDCFHDLAILAEGVSGIEEVERDIRREREVEKRGLQWRGMVKEARAYFGKEVQVLRYIEEKR